MRGPEGWRSLPFSEFAEINPKRPLKKGQRVPFVEMAAVPTHGSQIQYLQEREAGSGGSCFRNGDTLFARITPCTENGKIAYVDCLPESVSAKGSTEFIVFGPRQGLSDSRYLYHLARSTLIRRPAIARMAGTTGRQRVPNAVFDDIEIQAPPLAEQRLISKVLCSVDEAITATQAVIEQTRMVKQAVLNCLLTKGIGHTRFKQTEFGSIPEDWKIVPLRTVAEVQTGVAKGKKDIQDPVELPYLRVANVQDGYIDLTELKTITISATQVERYSLRSGDVLMTEGGDFDKLGRGDIWKGQVPVCLHQNHVFAVHPNPNLLVSEFLAALTASAHGKNYFLGCAKRTTNLASINSTQVKDFPVLLPGKEEQERIVQQVAAYSLTERSASDTLAQLEQTKSALMSDLLTGRKRVSADALSSAL